MALSLTEAGWHDGEISGAELMIDGGELTFDDSQCEMHTRPSQDWLIGVISADFKELAMDEPTFGIRPLNARRSADEVDAVERFVKVKRARVAIEADTIPIKDAVSRVAVLLDLVDDEACADGMDLAARNEQAVASSRFQNLDAISHGAFADGLLKGFTSHTLAESGIEFGTLLRMNHEPHFRLRFAADVGSQMRGRMDLNAMPLSYNYCTFRFLG